MIQQGILNEIESQCFHEEFDGFVIISDDVSYCCNGLSHVTQRLTEFRSPNEAGKILLTFDPRGQNIEVLDGSTAMLETIYPQ